jgi:hypothetical protein
LVINLPAFILFVIVLALVLSPALLWLTDVTALGVIGTVATVGLFFVYVFLAIIVAAALSLFKHFFRRKSALQDLGPVEAIKAGFGLVKANLKDVLLTWLVMVGIQIGYAIAMIPVVFLLLAVAAVSGGLLGVTVGGLSSMFAGDLQAIIAGVIAGVPIFLLLLVAPLVFLGGLKETYVSSAWTLAYREALALEALEDDSPEAAHDQAAAL